MHLDLETYFKVVELQGRSGVLSTSWCVIRSDRWSAKWRRIHEHGRQHGIEEGRKFGYLEGHRPGYRKAATRFRLTHPCNRCGQPKAPRVGDEDVQNAIRWLTESGWAYSDCPAEPA